MAEQQEPKKAQTAFFLYLAENRPKLTNDAGKSKGAVSKLGSQRWNALSEKDKKPYLDKAAKAKEEYAKALEVFRAAGGQVGKRKAEKKEKRDAAKKGGKKAKVKGGGPKKPTGGGYGQFLHEVRGDIVKNLPPGSNKITATAKVAGEKWKALPADKKEPYIKLYEAKTKAYKIELEKWKKEQAEKGEADGGAEGDDGEDGEDDDDDDDDGEEDDE